MGKGQLDVLLCQDGIVLHIPRNTVLHTYGSFNWKIVLISTHDTLLCIITSFCMESSGRSVLLSPPPVQTGKASISVRKGVDLSGHLASFMTPLAPLKSPS